MTAMSAPEPDPTPLPRVTMDLRIGEAACLKGQLRREDLDAAVAEQSIDQVEGRSSRTLPEILFARGAISTADWKTASIDLSRQQAEREAAVEEARGDNLIGRLLVHRGWTTEARVSEALKLQAAMAAKGYRPVPRVGTILVELGALTHEQSAEIPALMRSAVLFCPDCGHRVEVAGAEAGQTYRCPHCGNALRAPREDLRADEKAAASDLLLGHPLPREVETVIDDHTRQFARYTLVDVLGRGGMAIVYRAWDAAARRFVALKVFDPGDKPEDRETYESDLKRFIREGRTASRLKHPHIVEVYEAGVEKDRYYIVMEYIAGATLEGIIREAARPVWKGMGPADASKAAPPERDPEKAKGDGGRGVGRLPPFRAAELVRDIALAVHYAHRHGVLHRDLKPQNILIDPAGEPHITDFGIALDLRKRKRAPTDMFPNTTDAIPRFEPPTSTIPTIAPLPAEPSLHNAPSTASLTVDGFVVGTPAYMSPEQLRGERDLDSRTDVYGLGAILYESLTGRAPFTGENVEKTVNLVLESPVVAPSEIVRDLHAPDLEAICLKALAKDRALRYASALDVAQDLERFLRGEPVTARVPRNAQVLPPTKDDAHRMRNLTLVLAGEVIVILALLTKILGWW
jgi:serine/threonine protein kinase/predicted RNA-binding Zn-ribbon protein involved in translation (DUF1610 family)